jgi:hypothetical protein
VCAAAPAWAVPDRDLVECLQQGWAVVQQLIAVTVHLISQAQAQGLPREHGATSTVVWLRQQLRVKPGTAKWLVAVADALHSRPGLDDAVCAGGISAEHATTIAATLADLPADLGREITDKAQAALLERAGVFDAITLGKIGARILDHVAPEVAEKRDGDLLDKQDAKAHHQRGFTLSPLGNGQVRLSGYLDTSGAAEARRLACDAQVLPAILNGNSQPMDLGRARRLFTGPLRRALILRDHGCTFPGCDRPARWSEGHHLLAWADGGTTALSNACLICRRHHRLLHNSSGWQVRLGPDGHPEFLPPATIDPERRPQRNAYPRRE